ncbi:MAG: hypothetical protein R3F13_02380 [Prosthecobacter sp.]
MNSLAAALGGFNLLHWHGIGYEEGSLSLCISFDIWDVHPANVLLSPEATVAD